MGVPVNCEYLLSGHGHVVLFTFHLLHHRWFLQCLYFGGSVSLCIYGMMCTTAEIVSTFDHPELVKLGHCDLIEEVMIGEDSLIRFSGVGAGEACTIVVRHAFRSLSPSLPSCTDLFCVGVHAPPPSCSCLSACMYVFTYLQRCTLRL